MRQTVLRIVNGAICYQRYDGLCDRVIAASKIAGWLSLLCWPVSSCLY